MADDDDHHQLLEMQRAAELARRGISLEHRMRVLEKHDAIYYGDDGRSGHVAAMGESVRKLEARVDKADERHDLLAARVSSIEISLGKVAFLLTTGAAIVGIASSLAAIGVQRLWG